ncbi:MAG: transcription termination/antitermination factor NusG [Abditibacteriota bacterium]|nr:transcription termination/antitermination factor NusG [Abditibacteriota bacterium]MBP5093870.1 transcription termination/antitermination factor NusG [Abditibacteriota bacterium]MBP5718255.1 transcription termination/antitermination factor NusG [Abditibacteriota bacterium]MBP5737943.1 transcription termination/antitermination factor NusG [Abditibacteriota bacterium]
MSRRQWYAVHTYSGHENKVKENLERRAESLNLSDRFFRVLVPTELEVTKKDGKRREIKRKIFPGYVLVEMILDESTWHLVRGTSGVTGFVSSGNNPIPLEPGEVDDILRALESPEAKPRVKWAVDEVIRVKDGPFTDFTGKIEEINVEKEKLKVLISIFGRDTPVELEFDQVEKID